ncbi:hypothetical protein [Pseudomonas sp. URIL14HWK12:I5]|uniref:hypothetical protein n=1 Tax=Pseudomonas sp. URIL14HWK12:I5 TaxID=1261630 RepID=UPI0009D8EACE|nr:hypothetical protein [Pseudomonas sp. URIL14HWK12:I5]SMC70143.1 hypothetical protein SAMN05660385_02090 [Pseudomonas sp. URIL14HWK12:I5]
MPTENRSNDADGWIACDDGLHLIQMDKNLSHYGWVFRKITGGLPYSVREATSHEMAHAQARQHLRIGVAQIAGQAQAPQPHPEPLAWMVGTAIWWTKEEAERDAAETGLPIVPVGPLVSIPDGYCLMPKRLTAENGAKALLRGEFKLEVTQECPECRELDEPVEGCEICDGEGEYGQRHIIPWDKIKYIYSEAVRGLAIQPNTIQEPA